MRRTVPTRGDAPARPSIAAMPRRSGPSTGSLGGPSASPPAKGPLLAAASIGVTAVIGVPSDAGSGRCVNRRFDRRGGSPHRTSDQSPWPLFVPPACPR